MGAKQEQRWREHFTTRKDAPPGGWPAFLAPHCDRTYWFSCYSLYLRSHAWALHRQGALRRAEGHCQLCPATRYLQVHHVTYVRVGCEQIEDLRGQLGRYAEALEEDLTSGREKIGTRTREGLQFEKQYAEVSSTLMTHLKGKAECRDLFQELVSSLHSQGQTAGQTARVEVSRNP